jgi:hypothetical protein
MMRLTLEMKDGRRVGREGCGNVTNMDSANKTRKNNKKTKRRRIRRPGLCMMKCTRTGGEQ